MEYSCAFPVPTLPNLKHLELIVPADDQWALNNLNSFLKASPSLQRLVLKLEFSPPPPPPPPCKPLEEKLQLLSCELREELRILLFEPPKMLKAPECPHRNLKIVEIVGYCGRINVVEHVMYLIENVVALEKLVIDPVRCWCIILPVLIGKLKMSRRKKRRGIMPCTNLNRWFHQLYNLYASGQGS